MTEFYEELKKSVLGFLENTQNNHSTTFQSFITGVDIYIDGVLVAAHDETPHLAIVYTEVKKKKISRKARNDKQ